ncbi:iron chelate uptake ABC transporter family permease subunit [Faecalibacterium prausnitzii]|uniref:iron chelate uptake ABC transporter family permease subunit n=1 Tax=Faecalibacterium prausnitzii TaxID=853 RepID=UPI003AAE162A
MGLTIAAMITASVVVVVGSISYIGLIVPDIVAMFKGDRDSANAGRSHRSVWRSVRAASRYDRAGCRSPTSCPSS